MRNKSAEKVKLSSFDDLFGKEEPVSGEVVTSVPIDLLHPFKNHPFHVLDDEKMEETVESVKQYGILMPGIVRPYPDGGYEVVAGHRRWRACELAGLEEMPVIIRDIDDDTATVIMVDTNIQREDILPSEKARAYSMKYEAMKHQGKKGKGSSLDEVGEAAGESGKTVQRYIWLARLSDELLDMVDKKKIGLVQGVDISFLTEQAQEWVQVILEETGVAISTTQSSKLKEYGKNGELTLPMVRLILTEEKPRERKVTIKADKISRYFTEDYSSEDIENIIYQLLEEWQSKQKRRHGKGGDTINFDYYYGIEAEQFSFYRVPRLLIKDERFKGLSSDAKLLYGLMLDRMSLSMKNGWLDDENRAYIIYTVDAIMEDLGCAKATCVKIMKELDTENGIGLIEKKRRGLGKPDIIYVKNFSTITDAKTEEKTDNADKTTEVQKLNLKKSNMHTSRSSEIELQEVQDLDHQKFTMQTSRGSESELAEVHKADPIYTNYNKTNQSYIDMSYTNPINQSGNESKSEKRIDLMDDVNAYIELIKDNIEYEHHMKYDDWQNKALYEELFEVICEVVCVKRTTIRIAGEDYPYELVKSKFLKLNSGHLEYVIGCMHDTNTKITNIKAYMVTALYNAPSTMNHYYQQEVQHDMYGGGWHEKGIV